MQQKAQRSHWQVQADVLGALLLRDIRTRFFGNGLGYVVAVLWPTSHIVLLLLIYFFLGRASPLGDSIIKFFSVALVPVMSCIYMSRFIMMSSLMNKPLMSYPIVSLVDIIIARALLESATSCLVALIVMAGLFSMDIPVAPNDAPQAAYAFLSAVFLGFGFGSLNAVISFKLPGWSLVVVLVNVTVYALSGVVFMPDALPEAAQRVVAFNPLLHSVEWMREAYYFSHKSSILDKSYPFIFGAICLIVALGMDRFLRKFLHS